ncbi:uncharacterized protein YydD (DUF2326 family) [Catenuloplanes nepalensis]|uniref:Uncharacterized protein YydD (DUF2326 family) n=1 Tax=Catenuloplanes nepalensis TaxID=587533 RepID=A0ABT9MX07_9ACTN|nr:ABC-three component system protein [Catenuloplanes nepalensis]MDP9795980.1 uncharacterized protein YydD (DUF2326 family) [Catenuloplanes nepalensis]
MLRRLGASDHRFRALQFRAGLNILVADTANGSRDTDSRNGAGKSSMIELIHFMLGERSEPKSLPRQAVLQKVEFNLTLDWPRLPEPVTVHRSGERHTWVRLHPAPSGVDQGQLDLGTGAVRNTEWQRLIERDLFNLPEQHDGVSGRNLLSFLIRRVSSAGYVSAVHGHVRQADHDAATNLAYLFGLDHHLADRYRALRARENARQQMQKAAQDPLMGRIIGKVADLRSEIALAERRVAELQGQVDNFHVVPEYEHLRRRADDVDQAIRRLIARDTADRRNLEDVERALQEAIEPDISYLEPVYGQLGVILGGQVRRRFDEVEAFHHSVVRNRRRYLEEERDTVRQRLADSEAERGRLGAQLAATLRTLEEGGALSALTTLQQVLGEQRATLSALQHRYEAAQALESTRREITQARLSLQDEMNRDIEDRRGFVDEATVLFSDFARALYGSDRSAYLRFEAAPNSLRIEPHIQSDNSGGIGSMVIFCFDLTLAVLAHRAGRAPDFLVHDSHLFDGVDERQLAAALGLAARTAEREGLQYIISMNSDDLDKAGRRGFDATPYRLPEQLTDRYEDGGLFGFRF